MATSLMLPIQIPLHLWILLLTLVSWRLAWTEYGSHHRSDVIVHLIRFSDGRFQIETGDGTVQSVQICNGYCIYRWWIFLPMRLENGALKNCLILPDVLDRDSFRKLYRALRLQIFIGRRYF